MDSQELSYRRFNKTESIKLVLSISPNQVYLITQSKEDKDTLYEVLGFLGNMICDTEIRIWNLEKLQLGWVFTHPIPCFNVLFSRDSQWLVHGTKDVFVHHLEDGKQLLRFTLEAESWVSALTLAIDKSWLAMADTGGSVSILNTQTQQRTYYLPNLPVLIRNLDLTIDSQFLIATGKKGGALTFRIFQKNGDTYLKLIHSSMELNLACSGVKIQGTRGLSKDNLQLLQQNDAQGTPILLSQENYPDEKESIKPLLPRELTFDRAVVKRSSVTSFLNSRAVLDYSLWQVGLVRDTASEKNKEHTFIVVEGMDAFSRCFFWRFDLATKIGEEKVKEGFAKIIINKQENILLSERKEIIMAFLNPHESKGRGLESLVGHVWQLKREMVLQLYQDVQKDAAQGLLPYAQIGNQSFFGGNGDSCYSWARRRLLALGQEKIAKQLPSKIIDYLGMVPSWNLTKPLQAQPPVPPGSGMFSS